MRVLLIERDMREYAKELPAGQNYLVPAGVAKEFEGESLPVYIRALNSAANEYFIDLLKKLHPPA